MIPERIETYLRAHDVPYYAHAHPRAVTALELAQAMHVTGHRVAKPVIVKADECFWMCVVPASGNVDLERVATLLDAYEVRLAREDEFESLFPGCEVGAEPALGTLFSLPVVMDRELTHWSELVLRAGSHEDALEIPLSDYEMLEWPRIGSITARG